MNIQFPSRRKNHADGRSFVAGWCGDADARTEAHKAHKADKTGKAGKADKADKGSK